MSHAERVPEVLVTGGARTAAGIHGGGLRDVSSTELAVAAMTASLKVGEIPVDSLAGVVVGGPAARAPDDLAIETAAAASIGAPEGAAVLSVHRHEATGLQALLSAAHVARDGGGTVLVAAAESSSRAPLLVPGLRFHARDDQAEVIDALNAVRLDPVTNAHAILRDEAAADAAAIGREAQDAWALRSHERAYAADGHVVSVAGVDADEGVRHDLTADSLAALKPLFKLDGNVTGGNWAPPADASAAFLVSAGQSAAGETDGAGRLAAGASGAGAAAAARAALSRAGCGLGDVSVAELHESSAAGVLALVDDLGLDADRVNPGGGAIATGSAQAAAGAVMVVRLLAALERRGGGVGLVAVSGLGGQGAAVVLRSG